MMRVCLAVALAVLLFSIPAVWGQSSDKPGDGAPANSRTPDRTLPPGLTTQDRVRDILNAVVRVRATIPTTAHSARFLGTEREGSGVLIDDKGHILTVGYIVLEAATIEVETSSGGKTPAFAVGYDAANGFGLLRSAVPLKETPLPIGESTGLTAQDPVAIVSFGPGARIAPAVVAMRRTFVGYWEYLLENAIFTVPPAPNYAGAALVNQEFKLVGIGSLFVRDTLNDGAGMPGNMFIPIDALKPILDSMKRLGRPEAGAKPWIGVYVVEQFGRVLITDVSLEGPAQRAGLETGDIILGINDAQVSDIAQFYRSLWGLGQAGVTVRLKILHGSDVRAVNVQTIDRYTHYKMTGMN
ncbi:MAG: serine protease [Candidatus Lambdaproteobacteria bacterium]|nr:serine protease [Candidatus Lambdaproteobacteria bacterium]